MTNKNAIISCFNFYVNQFQHHTPTHIHKDLQEVIANDPGLMMPNRGSRSHYYSRHTASVQRNLEQRLSELADDSQLLVFQPETPVGIAKSVLLHSTLCSHRLIVTSMSSHRLIVTSSHRLIITSSHCHTVSSMSSHYRVRL